MSKKAKKRKHKTAPEVKGVMPWGRFVGQPIAQVPRRYLDWLGEQEWMEFQPEWLQRATGWQKPVREYPRSEFPEVATAFGFLRYDLQAINQYRVERGLVALTSLGAEVRDE